MLIERFAVKLLEGRRCPRGGRLREQREGRSPMVLSGREGDLLHPGSEGTILTKVRTQKEMNHVHGHNKRFQPLSRTY